MRQKRLSKRIISLICVSLVFFASLFIYCKVFIKSEIYTISFISPYADSEPDIIEEVSDEENINEVARLREYYGNDDIVGKLFIEGTTIDEPILKARDNKYYLNHNAYGKYQQEGSLFMDYRTNLGDKKVLIFGHSAIGWNVPFNELQKYYDKDFYNSHQFITVVSDEGTDLYQIFSVYVETYDFTYMNLKMDDETYNKYLKKYKYNSLYDTGVWIDDGDEILILQTCSTNSKYKNYKKKFLLVIGKKIEEDKK